MRLREAKGVSGERCEVEARGEATHANMGGGELTTGEEHIYKQAQELLRLGNHLTRAAESALVSPSSLCLGL